MKTKTNHILKTEVTAIIKEGLSTGLVTVESSKEITEWGDIAARFANV